MTSHEKMSGLHDELAVVCSLEMPDTVHVISFEGLIALFAAQAKDA
jgi:hypothetical protein